MRGDIPIPWLRKKYFLKAFYSSCVKRNTWHMKNDLPDRQNMCFPKNNPQKQGILKCLCWKRNTRWAYSLTRVMLQKFTAVIYIRQSYVISRMWVVCGPKTVCGLDIRHLPFWGRIGVVCVSRMCSVVHMRRRFQVHVCNTPLYVKYSNTYTTISALETSHCVLSVSDLF